MYQHITALKFEERNLERAINHLCRMKATALVLGIKPDIRAEEAIVAEAMAAVTARLIIIYGTNFNREVQCATSASQSQS